jgi:hypothetical protein
VAQKLSSERAHSCYIGCNPLDPGFRGDPHVADSLTCLEWIWEDRKRVTCSASDKGNLLSGGHWTEGDANGRFRIIRIEDPRRVSGSSRPVLRPRVFVQWVEARGMNREMVRTTAELPIDSTVIAVYGEMELSERQGRWRVLLNAERTRTKGSSIWSGRTQTGWLTYELGPPRSITTQAIFPDS